MRYNILVWTHIPNQPKTTALDEWTQDISHGISLLDTHKHDTNKRGLLIDFNPEIPQILVELHKSQIINCRAPLQPVAVLVNEIKRGL